MDESALSVKASLQEQATNTGNAVLPITARIEGPRRSADQREAKLPEVGGVLLLVGGFEGGKALVEQTLEVASSMGVVRGGGRGGLVRGWEC